MTPKKITYVQYGCGLSAPDSWMNFDASPNLWLERLTLLGRFYTGKKKINGELVRKRFPKHIVYGNIVSGLPLQDSSCSGIYASHVLEHLALEDFRIALKNTHQLLKPNGIFRLIVPDLRVAAIRYVESSDKSAATSFIHSIGMGSEKRVHGLKAIPRVLLANHGHLWMWDYESLERELSEAGFVDIREAKFNDSVDRAFLDVESASRFEDAVAIECKKI